MSTDPWNEQPSRGLWSDQVENEEAQKGGELDGGAYPTLSQASRTKGKKKTKQAMSLSQFMTQETETANKSRYGGGTRPQTNTEILMTLPTQPKQKDPNEEGHQQQRWGGQRGGFGREERGRRAPHRDEEVVHSRADESSDWGTDKRSAYPPSQGSSRNYDRPHSRGSSRGYEEADSRSNNRYHSSGGHRSGFGNFHDHDRDRRQGYGFHASSGGGGGGGGGFSSNRWQDDKWSHSSNPPQTHHPTSERKRLVIDKRTKPLDPVPTSEVPTRPKQKSNPFGEARPREEVLKERGVDVASRSDVFSSRSDVCSEQDFKSQSGSPGGSYRGSTVSGADTLDNPPLPPPIPRESKPKSEDPFGGARPREDVLNERRHISGPSVAEEVQEEDFDHQHHHQKLNPQVEELAHRIEAM